MGVTWTQQGSVRLRWSPKRCVMDRLVRRAPPSAWVFTSIAIVACASRAAVVLPPSGNPGLQSVADRVHSLAVLVRARALIGERTDGGGLRVHEALSLASGVLIGNGLALTELGAVTLTAADGRREVASQIEVVVDDVGPLPAHVLAA